MQFRWNVGGQVMQELTPSTYTAFQKRHDNSCMWCNRSTEAVLSLVPRPSLAVRNVGGGTNLRARTPS